jgi:hypothetical protein
MTAIADTSSIILLAKVGRLAILRELYGEVYVPPVAAAELRAKPDVASQEVERFIGMAGCIRRPENNLLVQALSADLGAGEAQAIALATEVPGGLLIMDDAEGRRAARRLGLGVIVGCPDRGKGAWVDPADKSAARPVDCRRFLAQRGNAEERFARRRGIVREYVAIASAGGGGYVALPVLFLSGTCPCSRPVAARHRRRVRSADGTAR